MMNYFVLYISFCQAAYQNLSPGNSAVPSINWVAAKLWLTYLLMCMQKKPDQRREKNWWENTHSATNNRLFSPFPLALLLTATTWKERQPKQFPAERLEPPQRAHGVARAQHPGAARLRRPRGAGRRPARHCWPEKARSVQNLGPVQEHVWKPTWVWSRWSC